MVSVKRGIAGGELLGFFDVAHQLCIEAAAVADDFQADIVLMQLADFTFQHLEEQLHQKGYFIGRTPPVLAAEGKQRQIFHAQLAAGLDHFAHRFHPALVPHDARHETLLRPAPIAIHDDGDVTRDSSNVWNRAGGTEKRQRHYRWLVLHGH